MGVLGQTFLFSNVGPFIFFSLVQEIYLEVIDLIRLGRVYSRITVFLGNKPGTTQVIALRMAQNIDRTELILMFEKKFFRIKCKTAYAGIRIRYLLIR